MEFQDAIRVALLNLGRLSGCDSLLISEGGLVSECEVAIPGRGTVWVGGGCVWVGGALVTV